MRAISPVIATVIIVSVAIAISIAVALWLTGITSGFTQTENLQIISSYAESGSISANSTAPVKLNVTIGSTTYNFNTYTVVKNYTGNGWIINITIKNTGTVTATVDNVFIDGIPYSTANGVIAYYNIKPTINPGQKTIISIVLGSPFSSGQMVNIKIHTASGRDYPTTIKLP